MEPMELRDREGENVTGRRRFTYTGSSSKQHVQKSEVHVVTQENSQVILTRPTRGR